MSQFYVPDAASMDVCQQSINSRSNVTVSGVDISDERVKAFTGAVQSVLDMGKDKPDGRRWLITMPDALVK
jgi:hypothetical protein